MVKRCFYCRDEIEDGSVVDMCMKCMHQVWGEKMAKAIIQGMEGERDKGNLELGRVGENKHKEFENLGVSKSNPEFMGELISDSEDLVDKNLDIDNLETKSENIFSDAESIIENISSQSESEGQGVSFQ